MSNFRLVERDYTVMQEIDRWRVITARHIKKLADFSSLRTCDRRLKKLTDAGFLTRQKILYGFPYLYFLTRKAKVLINASTYQSKVRVEQIQHDLIVLDTAIFVHNERAIEFNSIQTEKQLHSVDGFSNRKHRPDFIFVSKEGYSYCVEVELSLKAKTRLEKNIKDNFTNYDFQLWIVPDLHSKIAKILQNQANLYPSIEILSLKEVRNRE